MKIAIDLDGVVRDLMASLVHTYKIHHPEAIVHKIVTWDIAPYFPIGKDIYKWGFHKYADEVFYYHAYPHDYAIEGLRLLKSHGHHLTILTYQNSDTVEQTVRWIKAVGLNSIIDEIRIMINDTSKPGSGKASTDYDLYIDDSPNNIGEFLRVGKRVVCMNQPWNSADVLSCHRVNNMLQLCAHIGIQCETN